MKRITKAETYDYCIVIPEGKMKHTRLSIWRGYQFPHQVKKNLWYGKETDPDFHTPPAPHLHSSNGRKKMDVYTGQLYDVQKKSYEDKYVDESVLREMWSDPKFLEFVDKSRKIALSKCPDYKLPPIPDWGSKTDDKAKKINRRIALVARRKGYVWRLKR